MRNPRRYELGLLPRMWDANHDAIIVKCLGHRTARHLRISVEVKSKESLMPEKKTIARAKDAKRRGKSPTSQAGEFVREEMHHIRRGKHGARSSKQAIAIGLSKARRAGIDLPPPKKGRVSETTRKSAQRAYAAGRGGKRGTSARRSRATKAALKREGRSAASRQALSSQARTAAQKRTRAQRSASAKRAARTKGARRRSAAAQRAARTRAHR